MWEVNGGRKQIYVARSSYRQRQRRKMMENYRGTGDVQRGCTRLNGDSKGVDKKVEVGPSSVFRRELDIVAQRSTTQWTE
jgi:hypothetical protein